MRGVVLSLIKKSASLSCKLDEMKCALVKPRSKIALRFNVIMRTSPRQSILLPDRTVRSSCSVDGFTTRQLSTASSVIHLEHGYNGCHDNVAEIVRLRNVSFSTAISLDEERSLEITHRPIPYKSIRILYGTQTGTAKLLAVQLKQFLEESNVVSEGEVFMQSLSDQSSSELLHPLSSLHLFVVSTTGVGEIPENARTFYKWLLESHARGHTLATMRYAVFALGNSKAHPHHFCAAGKDLDQVLREKLNAKAVYPIALGDDGNDSLEDDFDNWQRQIVDYINNSKDSAAVFDYKKADDESSQKQQAPRSRERLTKYAQLQLVASSQNLTRQQEPMDLLDICPHFYKENSVRMNVIANRTLNLDPSATGGLCEMQIELPKSISYETGDHCLLYPRNPDILVEAYLQVLKTHSGDPIDRYAIIQLSAEKDEKGSYPHPSGISVYETLSHCVDLMALPSPSFARYLTSKGRYLNYREDIILPRRTVLDLLLESSTPDSPVKISLEDLLYNLPPLQPRYYSIASSNKVHTSTVYLTYRPVKYMTIHGVLHEGLCTSFMKAMPANVSIVAAVQSNPKFRLPSNDVDPVLLIAGGCGVAPIRAFLEEIIFCKEQKSRSFGPVHLFLGFRNPLDQAYVDLVDRARELGVLDTCRITFTAGCIDCALVSDTLTQEAATVYQLLHNTSCQTYVCGGAKLFGVAVENAVCKVLQEHGCMDTKEATTFLQKLIANGRFHQDLSD